ncbi:MAG: hypothetical protein IJA81_02035 [Akkermansia sp.]|nr:hypothetical protein [Akkermansia sp.]
MSEPNESETAITPDIVSPNEADNKEPRPMRRASDLKFAALDYEHADIPPLPTPEKEAPQSTVKEDPVKQLPPPQDNEPKPEGKDQESEQSEEVDESSLKGIYIPPVLSWVLGFMSLVLFLVTVGLLMVRFWQEIPMIVRVCTLVCIPAFLWVVYIIGFHKGHKAPEAASLLATISWLDALLIYQFCIQALPIWILSSIFAFGLMLIPLIKPWKMAVCSLGVGAVIQYALMGYGMATASTYGEWALTWAAAVSMTMVWSHIGSWCALTSRKGYKAYSLIGPIAQFVFLLMLITMLVYPQYLVPMDIDESASLNEWLSILGVWIVAMLPILPLQRHFAAVCNHPNISNSFLLYWSISIMTLPLGLLLVRDVHTLLLMPLILAYLFSMVYYGADYHVPSFVLMGSIGIFLTLVSIPIHVGTGLIGSAAILFVLSVAFFMSMVWLNGRRRAQIMRRKEEIATLRAVEKERRNMKYYQEKERFSIALPGQDK